MRERNTRGSRYVPPDEMSKAIKATREANGMSIRQMATHLRVSEASVWRWETEKRQPLTQSLTALLKMAPPEWQHIFERRMGKTLSQVIWEETRDTQEHVAALPGDWSEKPEENLAGIHGMTLEAVQSLVSQARMGYEGAARALVKVLESAVREARKPRRRL